VSDSIAKEKRWRLSLTIESRRNEAYSLSSIDLTIACKLYKCDSWCYVHVHIIQGGYLDWTALNWFNSENFKLRNKSDRPCRNNPQIRNIATETNHLVNEYFPTWTRATCQRQQISKEGRTEGRSAVLHTYLHLRLMTTSLSELKASLVAPIVFFFFFFFLTMALW